MSVEKHWTEKSVKEFVNRISFDFITQLAKKMESLPLKQGDFARRLGLTDGRISQIFNNPGNLTLNKIVEYARALGMKVSIVAYDDGDYENTRGPISSEIFAGCWETAGKPIDFWGIDTHPHKVSIFLEPSILDPDRFEVIGSDNDTQVIYKNHYGLPNSYSVAKDWTVVSSSELEAWDSEKEVNPNG